MSHDPQFTSSIFNEGFGVESLGFGV